jgi:glycosyl-4,4'-diaponeurosporenoate acyltransferase
MTADGRAGQVAWVLALSGAWFAIGLVTGLVANGLPLSAVGRDTWLTRLRGFEREGRSYERWLHINRWKDRLPEAGDTFPGGMSKRHLPGRGTPQLLRFAAETRRAEYVHWANAVAGPAFFLVLPAWAGALMTAFGLAVHLPFVCIQRYNRARIMRTLARRRPNPGRSSSHPAPPTTKAPPSPPAPPAPSTRAARSADPGAPGPYDAGHGRYHRPTG